MAVTCTELYLSRVSLFLKQLFIYFWLCWSVMWRIGFLLLCALLIVVASLVAEYRL